MQREEMVWAAMPTCRRCDGLRLQSWKEPAGKGEWASGVGLPLLCPARSPVRSACGSCVLQAWLAPCPQLTAPAPCTLALVSADFKNILPMTH